MEIKYRILDHFEIEYSKSSAFDTENSPRLTTDNSDFKSNDRAFSRKLT
jgi:hypothetical protein